VQRQEVEGFRWKDVYGIEPREPLVFTPHLSVVDSYHAGTDTCLGLTARQWIAGVDFLRVEDALTIARVANPDRVPQRSDGIDLMQSVMALAYCDLFLVRDRFVRNCSELATKALSRLKLAAIYGEAEKSHIALTCEGDEAATAQINCAPRTPWWSFDVTYWPIASFRGDAALQSPLGVKRTLSHAHGTIL
jgi:hypothetical protein